MKILVLGCHGQLGRCLHDQLETSDLDVVYASREEIDISDFEQTRIKVTKIAPNFVINATAYTAVDRAETDLKTAERINHLAVENIADICLKLTCWLVHISTDYVFDGTSKVPYKEEDQTNPQGVYGNTKLKGEKAIQVSGCQYIILRTAWVFSEYGTNFLKTMLRLGSERDSVDIVGDQIGCPTYAQDVARAIVTIIPTLNKGDSLSGLYHFCGDSPCSWYHFAKDIFSEADKLNLRTPKSVRSITTSDYETVAVRPSYSAFNCSKFEDRFNIKMLSRRRAIKISLKSLVKSGFFG